MNGEKMQCRRCGQLGVSVIELVWLILSVAIVAFVATTFGLGDSIGKVFWGFLSILIMIMLLASLLGRIINSLNSKKEKEK